MPAVTTDTRGIPCPGCQGTRWRVRNTCQHPRRVVRVRRCLGCGHLIRTAERIESVRVNVRCRPKTGRAIPNPTIA